VYLDGVVKRANESIFLYPEALEYLKGRGITEEEIKKYSVGYTKVFNVPNDGSDDYKFLKGDSYNFRGIEKKIIFPLKNLLGHTNGIVIRDITRRLFRQFFLTEARNIGAFFGLYEALPYIYETRKVFVHEAAIDCITFAKVFKNSVSVLTSFVNEQQYDCLSLLADRIILVFDSDEPGRHGVNKCLKMYGTDKIYNIDIGYKDSNRCLQKLGNDEFVRYIKARVPIFLRN
jgi:DNA primase